jgi:RNA polymerase sigma-70 factor (ECF subfamily)
MDNWAEIMAEHGPWVWRTAYRLLGNEADAADCFQDAFVAAVKVSRRESVQSWPALLRRLVTDCALDRLRERIRRRNRDGPSAALGEVVETAPGPSDQAQARELADVLRRAVAQLPAQQAAVFAMRFLDDASYGQIAAALDLEVSHVGVLLHRARATLRGLLASRQESRGVR